MNHHRHRALPTRLTAAVAGASVVALTLAGCGPAGEPRPGAAVAEGSDFYDVSLVHSIQVEFDEDDYRAMIDTYSSSSDKEWIEATVTIDGVRFERVGLRLKGNSSLQGLGGGGQRGGDQGDLPGGDQDTAPGDGGASPEVTTSNVAMTTADSSATPGFDSGDGNATADDPQELPWLIRLDKYVDGQEYQGRTDFVVRGNNSETSLNEAVALYVIGQAGLATEAATPVRFSVNGGTEALRLVIESPDDDGWNADTFDGEGITYKADSTGDYSYRGDDPASYEDVFDIKSTDGEEDYAPLIEFLDFVNNSTDEEFVAELPGRLDVNAFATYLAVQDLVANTDDIDGPGNNSYLRYDDSTGMMTVVSWDENLAYGAMPGSGGQTPGGQGQNPTAPDETMPGPRNGMQPPDGFDPNDLPTDLPTGMPDMPTGAGDMGDGSAGLPGEAGGSGPGGGDAGGGSGPGGGGFGGGDNALVNRFLDNDEFSALVDSAKAELQESIYDSGDAQNYLDAFTDTLTEQAGDLVDAETITAEAQAIAAYFAA